MKAVRGSKKKIIKRNLTTLSSSSVKQERLKPSKDVLELGMHLVEELGHADRGTTLSRWMSHNLAGLIHAAENEVSLSKRDAARKKAEELILKLWAQRTSLPGDADPMARYKSAVATLDILSPSSLPWQRSSAVKMHALVAELHDSVSKLVYGVLLSDVEPEIPRTQYEELAVSFLSHTEQRLHQLLGRVSIKFATHGDDAEPVLPADATTEERIRVSLKSLASKATLTLGRLSKELDTKKPELADAGQGEAPEQ